jgi:hypothetical protein
MTKINHALKDQKEESLDIESWMTDTGLWNKLAK